MKKSGLYIKTICLLLACVLSVCSFSITSSAASVYNSVHNEPDYNQYSGYLNLLVNDYYSSGTDLVTFAWTCFPLNNTGATPSTETIIHVNYSSVEFDWFSSSSSYYVMLWELSPDGNRVLRYSGTKNATSDGFYFSFDNNLVHGLSYKGNVNLLYPESGITQFDIPVVWASSSDEFDQLLGIYNQLVLMNETLNGKLDSMILQFSELIIQTSNTTMYLEGIHSWLIFDMMPQLTSLLEINNASLDLILELLESINFKIDQLLEMSDAEQEFVDSYHAAQQEQQEKLQAYIKDSTLNKPDIDVNASIDSYIDFDGVSLYGNVLGYITNHPIVIFMLLITFTMAFIGYALFGKKG